MSSVRILLDARKLGDGGIGVYIENLVDGLLELKAQGAIPVDLTLLIPSALGALLSEGVSPASPSRAHLQRILREWSEHVRLVPEDAPKYSFSEYFGISRRHAQLIREHHLYHSPHFTLPFGIAIPSVVTIHDVIHVSQPESFKHRLFGARLIRSAAKRAAHTITVSSTSFARLNRVVHLSGKPVSVIPNAVRRGIEQMPATFVDRYRSENDLLEPYYLFVGSDRPHKGFEELLDAWKILEPSFVADGHEVPRLVCVGNRFSEQTRRRIREEGLESRFTFIREVSVSQLALLYSGAQGVVIPSREEGFGLPALEAMACLTPVICTPEQSLQETCENCAWYADGFTGEALARAIHFSFTNKELSEAKVKQGFLRAKQFSREAVAIRTFETYLHTFQQYLRLRGQEEDLAVLSYGDREVYGEHLRKAL